ncbi:MAG: hypothetical protein EBS89_12980 [Proteobacteria bacterium]|nr:hypothetical protein [Pseudomonadota bacterium]
MSEILSKPMAGVGPMPLTFANARANAWEVMRAALAAVDPAEAVRRVMRLDGDTLTVPQWHAPPRRCWAAASSLDT